MNLQYISDINGKTNSVVIPIQDWEFIKRKYKNIEKELEFREPTKQEILDGIKDALNEVKLIEEGKVQPKSFDDFLNEL